jgi:hypothetical protein
MGNDLLPSLAALQNNDLLVSQWLHVICSNAPLGPSPTPNKHVSRRDRLNVSPLTILAAGPSVDPARRRTSVQQRQGESVLRLSPRQDAVPIEGGTMSILVLSRRGSDLLLLSHQFNSALVTSAKGSFHSCIRVVGNPDVGYFSLALTAPYRYRWLVTHLPWLWRKHSSGPLGNSTLLLRSCGMYHSFLRWSSCGGKLYSL